MLLLAETASSETVPSASTAKSVGADASFVTLLERFLPIFVEVFDEQLSRYMEVVGEEELTRRYTEKEFRESLLRRIQRQFPNQITEVSAKIHPEGFVGSGKVRLSSYLFPMQVHVGIVVQEERPHIVVQKIEIGGLVASGELMDYLETSVNQKIDRQMHFLKIKRFELYEGFALISVEREEVEWMVRKGG